MAAIVATVETQETNLGCFKNVSAYYKVQLYLLHRLTGFADLQRYAAAADVATIRHQFVAQIIKVVAQQIFQLAVRQHAAMLIHIVVLTDAAPMVVIIVAMVTIAMLVIIAVALVAALGAATAP